MTADLVFMFVLGAAAGGVLVSVLWFRKASELEELVEDLMVANKSADMRIEDLEAQIAPMDHDGDGRIGGSKPRKSH